MGLVLVVVCGGGGGGVGCVVGVGVVDVGCVGGFRVVVGVGRSRGNQGYAHVACCVYVCRASVAPAVLYVYLFFLGYIQNAGTYSDIVDILLVYYLMVLTVGILPVVHIISNSYSGVHLLVA